MFRYATLTLGNPLKPNLAPVKVRALIIGEDASLSLPPRLVLSLQLEMGDMRQVMIQETGLLSVPYGGPVKLSAGGPAIFSGAVLFGEEAIIGAALARELGIGDMAAPAILPAAALPAMASAADGARSPSVVPLAFSKDTNQHALKPLKTAARDVSAEERAHELLHVNDVGHIMRVDGFIDTETCRIICDYASRQKRKRLGVVDSAKTDAKQVVSKIDMSARDTFYVPIEGIEDMLREIFYNAFTQQIEPFFDIEIEFWEKPQLLCYLVGGKYGAHADADQWVDSGGEGSWIRNHNRDISVLLYLNDTFTGGELKFPKQDYSLQPSPGLLVAFPSHAGYLHGAEPTKSGIRYAIVSWAGAKGMARVRDVPENSVFMDEFGRAA